MRVWKLTLTIAFLTISFLAGCASTFGPGCNCGGGGGGEGFYQGTPAYGAAPSAAGQTFQNQPFQSVPADGGSGGSGGR